MFARNRARLVSARRAVARLRHRSRPPALAAPAQAAGVGACLITKTDTNPFFVKMKEGALAKSKELGVDLKTYAGKIVVINGFSKSISHG